MRCSVTIYVKQLEYNEIVYSLQSEPCIVSFHMKNYQTNERLYNLDRLIHVNFSNISVYHPAPNFLVNELRKLNIFHDAEYQLQTAQGVEVEEDRLPLVMP